MGSETSLEPERIGPTEQATIFHERRSAAMVRTANHTTSI